MHLQLIKCDSMSISEKKSAWAGGFFTIRTDIFIWAKDLLIFYVWDIHIPNYMTITCDKPWIESFSSREGIFQAPFEFLVQINHFVFFTKIYYEKTDLTFMVIFWCEHIRLLKSRTQRSLILNCLLNLKNSLNCRI